MEPEPEPQGEEGAPDFEDDGEYYGEDMYVEGSAALGGVGTGLLNTSSAVSRGRPGADF